MMKLTETEKITSSAKRLIKELEQEGNIPKDLEPLELAYLLDRLISLLKNKDSKIDRLMLEYCPDEMCQEQLNEWASN